MATSKKTELDDNELVAQPGYCSCPETFLTHPETGVSQRVPKPRWHNCEYIRRVNRKIIGNCLVADLNTADMPDGNRDEIDSKRGRWQFIFNQHMNYDRDVVLREMDEEERILVRNTKHLYDDDDKKVDFPA